MHFLPLSINFAEWPYEISIWVILVWIAIIIFTWVLNVIIQKHLKRHLNKAKLKIKGTRITLLRVLNLLLYFCSFLLAFQALRIENDSISLTRVLNYDIIPSINENKFSLSFMDILVILIIFTISRFVLNLFKIYIDNRFKDNPDFDEGTKYVYVQLAKYVIYAFAIVLSLNVVTDNLSVLLGGSAALLVGIGFGLQDMFRDMIAGILLLFEGTIKVGDIIRVQSKNAEGTMIARVLKINVRTTKIETRDGNTLIIPNSILTQNEVENWSFGSDLTRFHINVSIAYGSDTELAKDLLRQAALSHPEVKKTKPVLVRLMNFGDDGLEMQLSFWADQSWEVEIHKSDIRFEIDRLFRQHQIDIPFPQRTLHMPKSVNINTTSDKNN